MLQVIVRRRRSSVGGTMSAAGRALLAALVTMAIGACALPARAAESAWTGNGGGTSGITLWSDQFNWSGNTVPPGGNDVRFGTGFNSGLTINPVGNRTVGILIVDTTAAFNLKNIGGTYTLTLNGGNILRTGSSDNTQTVSSKLFLPAQGVFQIAGGGTLTLGGLNADATRGTITSAAGVGIVKTDTGLLTLAGPVTVDHLRTEGFGGGTTIDGASAIINLASATADGNAAVTVGNNSTLTVQNGAIINANAPGNTTSTFIDGPGAGMTVTGPGSRFNAGFQLVAGNGSNGTLLVDNQGTVEAATLLAFGVANNGHGVGRLQGGATAKAPFTAIGVFPGSTGVLTVTGNGSRLTTDSLHLGGVDPVQQGGTGSLTVSNGGVVRVNNNLNFWTPGETITVDGGMLTTGQILTPAAPTINLVSDPAGGSALVINYDTNGSNDTTFNGTIAGAGSLTKGGTSSVTLSGNIGYSGNTTVTGGTLVLPNGLGTPGGAMTVNVNTRLDAANVVNRRLAGGGVVNATGSLIIGDLSRTDGINFGGTLNVNDKTVVLADADRATLIGGIVNISGGGRLDSFAGITSGAIVNVAASGSATIGGGAFTNNGAVHGPTAAGTALTFTGDVNGGGAYTGNVVFSDGFSPGSSPANVSLQNVTFDGTATLTMELGGRTAGTQYDRLSVSGTATLGGTLAVTTINGFAPVAGDSFRLIDAASRSGTFGHYSGLSLGAGADARHVRWAKPVYDATGLTLQVSERLLGDATLDGAVNFGDLVTLAQNYNSSPAIDDPWQAGDFTGDGLVNFSDLVLLAQNYGAAGAPPVPAGAPAGFEADLAAAFAAVPEPGVGMLVSLVGVGMARRGRRRR